MFRTTYRRGRAATSVCGVNLKKCSSEQINKETEKFYSETDGREVQRGFTVFIIGEALDKKNMGAIGIFRSIACGFK